MTEEEKKAVLELQELYESYWYKDRFQECKALIMAFCILNKHLNDHTGWRIRFEGSKADDLVNVLIAEEMGGQK